MNTPAISAGHGWSSTQRVAMLKIHDEDTGLAASEAEHQRLSKQETAAASKQSADITARASKVLDEIRATLGYCKPQLDKVGLELPSGSTTRRTVAGPELLTVLESLSNALRAECNTLGQAATELVLARAAAEARNKTLLKYGIVMALLGGGAYWFTTSSSPTSIPSQTIPQQRTETPRPTAVSASESQQRSDTSSRGSESNRARLTRSADQDLQAKTTKFRQSMLRSAQQIKSMRPGGVSGMSAQNSLARLNTATESAVDQYGNWKKTHDNTGFDREKMVAGDALIKLAESEARAGNDARAIAFYKLVSTVLNW